MLSAALLLAAVLQTNATPSAGQIGAFYFETSNESQVWVDLTPEISASVEYRWLRTRLGLVPVSRENHHVNAVFAVKF